MPQTDITSYGNSTLTFYRNAMLSWHGNQDRLFTKAKFFVEETCSCNAFYSISTIFFRYFLS